MSKQIFKISILLIICSVFLSACTLPWKKKVDPTAPEQNLVKEETSSTITESAALTKQLKKFLNNNDLKNFLKENGSANNFSLAEAISLNLNSPFANYRADARVSSASDISKISGDYIYSLVRNDLIIVKSRPANEAKIINKITFKSRPQSIIVKGDSLLVYGADNDASNQAVYKKFRRQNSYTFLKVYDISDPLNPKLVRDLNFEGTYSNARLVGDYVYFLTNTPGTYFDGEPLLPRVLSNGEILNQVCEADNKACFAPEVYYFDIAYNSFKFFNINVININDNNENIGGQVYLLDNNHNAYISPNNIYISYANSIDEYSLEQAAKRELVFSKLSAEDQNKIVKIEAAPEYILNNNEKKLKSGTIIDNYLNELGADEQAVLLTSVDDSIKLKIVDRSKEAGKTSIYRFSMNGKISYEAIGEVDGKIIDNYSMEENGDFFRIATTLKSDSSNTVAQNNDFYSNIYVLDKSLKTVGSLELLATTEEVSAARFMGDRVYLSTVKSDSPLYTISLSDPTKPGVLGVVKVPGVYSYLLPLDPNGTKLISFGKDLGNNSAPESSTASSSKGLKLSLFDFSDLQKPKELDSYIIGDELSDSIALSDLSTLNYYYSDTRNFLAVPAVLKEKGAFSFSGVLVFNLVDNRLVIKGKIDHSFGGHFTGSDFINGFDYYDNTVKRSFHSGDSEDVFYSFSNKLLRINKFSDLSTVKDVILTSGSDDYIITQPAGGASSQISDKTSTNDPIPTAPVNSSEAEIIPSPATEEMAPLNMESSSSPII